MIADTLRLVRVSRDFAGRKVAEEALRTSQELLQAVISNLPVVLWACNAEGVITLCEGKVLDDYRVAPSRILGRMIQELFVDDAAIVRDVRRALTGESFSTLIEIPPLALHVHFQPLLDRNGTIAGVTGIGVDVTERRRMEGELRDSEELSRGVIDSISAKIAVIDAGGEIIAVNEAWRRFARESGAALFAADAVGANYLDVCRRAASDGVEPADEVMLGIRDVLDGRKSVYAQEHKCETPEGTRWFRMTARPLILGRRGAVIVHMDVTVNHEKEALAEELRATQRHERLRKDVLISHELRTPLSVIHGYLSTLLEYESQISLSEAREMIVQAHGAAQRLDDLITKVLTMSRLDHGMLDLEVRRLPLGDVLRAALSAASVYAGGHPVSLHVSDPAVAVAADPLWLQHVLLNLIDNARKYADGAGPIEITAAVDSGGGAVTVSVRDHGPGVPRRDLETIFEPFARSREQSASDAPGSGLGLAICRGIVEGQGGRIWADLPDGGGLQVTFTVPVAS